jgi:hypothetical protein
MQALLEHLLPGICEAPGQPPSSISSSAMPALAGPPGVETQAAVMARGLAPVAAALLVCGLTGEPLRDPVIAADGYTYEREAIEAWLALGNACSPVTRQPLRSAVVRPNFAVRDLM